MIVTPEQIVKLKDLRRGLPKGTERITFGYSGSGDSGDMEPMMIDGGEADIDDKMISRWENLAWEILSNNHGGWENNEGAYGTVTFDIEDKRIVIDHNDYVIETINTTGTFNYGEDNEPSVDPR